MELNRDRPRTWRRRALISVLCFVALNAIGGGIYGLMGARGLSKELLEQTPFESFFVPSLVLLLVVGGSALLAAGAGWRKAMHTRALSTLAAAILTGWILAQVAWIGYVSWLQPAMLGIALLIFWLAAGLPAQRNKSS
ncbi:MAG: hypothetical protein R3B07_02635 [Polyangiaceae bacterium]